MAVDYSLHMDYVYYVCLLQSKLSCVRVSLCIGLLSIAFPVLITGPSTYAALAKYLLNKQIILCAFYL